MKGKKDLPNWWWREEEGEPDSTYNSPYRNSYRYEETPTNEQEHNKYDYDGKKENFSVILNSLLDSLNEQKRKSEELEKRLNTERENIFSLVSKINKLEEVNFALKEAVRAISGGDPNKILGLEPEEEEKEQEPLVIPYLFVSKDAPKEIFDAVFRAAIKIYHPDIGGNEDIMKEVNVLKDKMYTEKGWS